MSQTRALAAEELRRRCDPASLPFASTEEVAPLAATIGQRRALDAIAFGLDIQGDGYNLFVLGPTGTGKRTTLRRLVEGAARERPRPADWVYLFDFSTQRRAIAVSLPTGRANVLARDMQRFVEDARREMARAFESDEYQHRSHAVAAGLEARRQEALGAFKVFAENLGLALEFTPAGIVTLPTVDGKKLTGEEFEALPDEQKERLTADSRRVDEQFPEVMAKMRSLEREARELTAGLDREVGLFAVGHLVDDLKARYADVQPLEAWLDAVREDVVEHLGQFRAPAEGDGGEQQVPEPFATERRRARENVLGQYEVNVLVGQPEGAGAPVVVENSPTYYNLFGRIEYRTVYGAVTTDHRNIRAGAVHRANGGYLVLQAADVLGDPFAWDRLKETLRERRIRMENIGAQYTLFPTQTFDPEPIPADLKVVLVGSPAVYQALYLLDEEFRKLFKVPAEFDVEMPWGDDEVALYASFVSSRVRDGGLRHFDRGAVARVIEHGARLAGDQRKLSTRFAEIVDLVTESAYWAGEAGDERVAADHVEKAIAERAGRSALAEDKVRELILDGTLKIETEGSVVGQMNGLAVLAAAGRLFGQPIRITASSSVGRGEIVHLDRETAMSGPIHTKGFLILTGFLQHHYGRERPLAVRASIVVEQSYGEIEGDSASLAELCAILSSLAEVPIRQGVAVTGSIDQHGSVQPVGGVNEKIEGFFEVCRRRGLTGDQGVMVPQTNVKNLMLAPEVIEAVQTGRFHVWAATRVDEAVELLTGLATGELQPDGTYPAGTLHRLVDDRMTRLTEAARAAQGRETLPGSGAS
jgi:lon-related putative ATP-dependent protease